jgi:hypothetical protein
MILALAGRRIDAAGAQPPRFPQAHVVMVAERLRTLFQDQQATALVCSAACGADLVALREAGALGMRRRIVLPFGRAEFRESSVIDRPGDWGPTYDTILDQLTSANDVVIMQGQPGDNAAYDAANPRILDEAHVLARSRNEETCAVVVWEGKSRGDDDMTAGFAAEARRRGLRVFDVLTI